MIHAINIDNSALNITPPPTKSATGLIWDVVSAILFPIALVRAVCWCAKRKVAHIILDEWDAKTPPNERVKWSNFWKGMINDNNRKLREAYRAEQIVVKTPDGVELKAILYKAKSRKQDVPTTIFFNHWGGLQEYEYYRCVLLKTAELRVPSNFITFNYRSTGDSTGPFNSIEDLVTDGSAIVQHVEKNITKNKANIHLFGHCLGGTIATKVKERNPDLGALVADRVAASTEHLIQGSFQIPKFLSYIASWILKKFEFDLDAGSSFAKLKGNNILIWHKKDEMIPDQNSLYTFVSKINHEYYSPIETDRFKGGGNRTAHSVKLSECSHTCGKDILEETIERLYPNDVVYATP